MVLTRPVNTGRFQTAPAPAVHVLRRAVGLGVDFIDTANSYGPGVSEELIAEALHPYPAGLVIATKGGLERPGPDHWVPNGRPEQFAGIAVFLASAPSAPVTGQVICVDGGLLAHQPYVADFTHRAHHP